MRPPFPGMDPYLEGSRWSDFHNRYLTHLAEALTQVVGPEYEVRIEEYVLVDRGPAEGFQAYRPDLIVGRDREAVGRVAAPAGVAAGVDLALPFFAVEPELQRRIEIRRFPGDRLVTVIELLSPVSKEAGDAGRSAYLTKRYDVLSSPAHLVELDLLRGGERLPMAEPLPPGDYYAIVSRKENRPLARVVAWRLEAPLPVIEVPLFGGEAVALDLQAAFLATYARSGYGHGRLYREPVTPPLGPEARAWADDCLAAWQAEGVASG